MSFSREPCNLVRLARHDSIVVRAPASELLLVDRCLEGEQEAARDLFRRQQARVQATLFRILGRNREIEDLLQEIFIHVFRSLRNYRGEAKLATWIDRITVRVAYRYLSKNKTAALTTHLVEDMPCSDGSPAQRSYAREGIRRLYAALSQLSPPLRIAFVLHEIDGRSIANVAECVGASVTATKLRVWRARRALHKRAHADSVLRDFLTADPTGAAL